MNRNPLFPMFLAVALLRLPGAAQLVAIEPGQAGPDFAVQGEFQGQSYASGKAAPFAAQVVAEGDGAFRVVFFAGGLPGDGWDTVHRFEAIGATLGGALDISGDQYHGTLRGDTLLGASEGGDSIRLARRVRTSPTAGLAPPPQATVLYGDGSLDAWDNATKDDRGFFAPLDPVATTKARFANFSLHVEFRLPFIPFSQGQSRANSGLKFLTAKFFYAEIQILDSFGNEARTDECGGIEVMYPPAVVANLPPLAWQTYDIHLTTPTGDSAAIGKGRMTVWHNGILIHADRELNQMAHSVNLALQKYNDPLFFRNIWIIEGDDHFAFFPGAAIRGGSAPRPGRAKSRSVARAYRIRSYGNGGDRAVNGRRLRGR